MKSVVFCLMILVILLSCSLVGGEFDEYKELLIINESGETKNLSINFADSKIRDIRFYPLKHTERFYVHPKNVIQIEIVEFSSEQKEFKFKTEILHKTKKNTIIVLRKNSVDIGSDDRPMTELIKKFGVVSELLPYPTKR
ncbi:hypothetical protein ACFLY5_00565 [Patescibacteria group bacterium]